MKIIDIIHITFKTMHNDDGEQINIKILKHTSTLRYENKLNQIVK